MEEYQRVRPDKTLTGNRGRRLSRRQGSEGGGPCTLSIEREASSKVWSIENLRSARTLGRNKYRLP